MTNTNTMGARDSVVPDAGEVIDDLLTSEGVPARADRPDPKEALALALGATMARRHGSLDE